MNIYQIPFVGMIMGTIEHLKAAHLHRLCADEGDSCWQEYAEVWTAFNHVFTGYVSTIVFCLVLGVGIAIYKRRCT